MFNQEAFMNAPTRVDPVLSYNEMWHLPPAQQRLLNGKRARHHLDQAANNLYQAGWNLRALVLACLDGVGMYPRYWFLCSLPRLRGLLQ